MATVLTNDIALFIVVPLTLGLHGMAALPTARLVIFEALAVNAGSVLTPMGNPQNLFLWQRSGVSLLGLRRRRWLPLAAIVFGDAAGPDDVRLFRSRRIETHEDIAPPPLTRRLLWTSLLLYPVFLLLLDLAPGLGRPADRRRRSSASPSATVVKQVDWALIVVFILMFVDLRLLAELAPRYRRPWSPASASHDRAAPLSRRAWLISQVMSNVPGAILLAEHSARLAADGLGGQRRRLRIR
jgi:Na+/H+ antiporter NhaD/arsenite permease-like protein